MNAIEEGLVSVVIPTFNRAHLIESAIASVREQSYSKIEIVVVDDGSTDDTLARLERMRASDLRVFVAPCNGGPARARNIGLRECSGEFVAFLDSDDRWAPWKTEAQVGCFRSGRPELGAVYSGRRVRLDDGSELEIRASLRGRIFDSLVRRNPIPLPTLMVKRAVLDHVGLFDPDLPACEDWDLMIRIARHYAIDCIAGAAVIYDGTGADRMSSRTRAVFIANHRIFRRYARRPPNREQRATYLALQSRELLLLGRRRAAARYATASLMLVPNQGEKLALRTLRQILRSHKAEALFGRPAALPQMTGAPTRRTIDER